MWYNLSTPFDRERFEERVQKLEDKGAMVELTEKTPRSLPQNAYLHTILAWFGLQIGCTLQDVKDNYFKNLVNADIFVRIRYDKYLDRDCQYFRSTADCTTEELSTAIARFRDWASREANVYIPSSEEYKALLYMQKEIDSAKKQL